MKFRNLYILVFFIFFVGCEQYRPNKSAKIELKPEKKYFNTGFALIYNQELDIKKLDNRSLQIFHKSLKKKSFVKITNPLNNKSLIAEVISRKVEFSNFYNSVISNRIAETLNLNIKEPYIEIALISQNSTFVAKKAKTFEEEKKVAQKAPIDGIKISNLGENNKMSDTKIIDEKFSYSIKIADFYYENTADLMIQRIKSETSIANIKLIKISKNNYRVLIGPFYDINSLKESFEKMNSLYFENLEILKNV
jgi:hypothetical protein|tara:strand:+ start:1366 stop:2118 length:753 start_codon:yes stop_codon:yes gene_type:complete